MAAGKPNWKMRAVVAFIVLFMVFLVFIFTDWGRKTMEDKMNNTYNMTDPDDRVNLPTANRWITLCWWELNILGNKKEGYRLYDEFLGVLPDPKTGEDFIDNLERMKKPNFIGKIQKEKDGHYTGWGLLHPRAPEALFEYLKVFKNEETNTYIMKKALLYRVLFFDLYPKISKTNKPHPNGYKYAQKFEDDYRASSKMKLFDPKHALPPKPPDFPGPID